MSSVSSAVAGGVSLDFAIFRSLNLFSAITRELDVQDGKKWKNWLSRMIFSLSLASASMVAS